MYTGGLIVNGDQVSRGEWPFIAALFYTAGEKFFCAGTLITSKHVVTASHCIQPKFENSILSPSDIVVYLGKHSLKTSFERGSLPVYVRQIIVHPDWKTRSQYFDADISVIVLEESVPFSNFIMPACWPFRPTPLREASIVSFTLSEVISVYYIFYVVSRLGGVDLKNMRLKTLLRSLRYFRSQTNYASSNSLHLHQFLHSALFARVRPNQDHAMEIQV